MAVASSVVGWFRLATLVPAGDEFDELVGSELHVDERNLAIPFGAECLTEAEDTLVEREAAVQIADPERYVVEPKWADARFHQGRPFKRLVLCAMQVPRRRQERRATQSWEPMYRSVPTSGWATGWRLISDRPARGGTEP